MSARVVTYEFDGLPIRTAEAADDTLWLNHNDVLLALGMEPEDVEGTKMIDEADTLRIAKRCQDEDKFERFAIWLVEEVGVGPAGARAARPVDDSNAAIN